MSGQGRTGDEGVHPDLIGKLDFDAPMPKSLVHMKKRGGFGAHDSICGDNSFAAYAAESVTCPACKKLLAKRRRRAA